MKNVIAAAALILACLLAFNAGAESNSRFQSLSGDFGRGVLSTLDTNKTQTATADNNSSNNLWGWGTAPKGNMVVDGKLVEDPLSSMNFADYTSFSKPVGVDVFTGRTIYSYPVSAGATKYFYIDPYTEEPVFVEAGGFMTETAYAESAGSTSSSSDYSLPPIFR